LRQDRRQALLLVPLQVQAWLLLGLLQAQAWLLLGLLQAQGQVSLVLACRSALGPVLVWLRCSWVSPFIGWVLQFPFCNDSFAFCLRLLYELGFDVPA